MDASLPTLSGINLSVLHGVLVNKHNIHMCRYSCLPVTTGHAEVNVGMCFVMLHFLVFFSIYKRLAGLKSVERQLLVLTKLLYC